MKKDNNSEFDTSNAHFLDIKNFEGDKLIKRDKDQSRTSNVSGAEGLLGKAAKAIQYSGAQSMSPSSNNISDTGNSNNRIPNLINNFNSNANLQDNSNFNLETNKSYVKDGKSQSPKNLVNEALLNNSHNNEKTKFELFEKIPRFQSFEKINNNILNPISKINFPEERSIGPTASNHRVNDAVNNTGGNHVLSTKAHQSNKLNPMVFNFKDNKDSGNTTNHNNKDSNMDDNQYNLVVVNSTEEVNKDKDNKDEDIVDLEGNNIYDIKLPGRLQYRFSYNNHPKTPMEEYISRYIRDSVYTWDVNDSFEFELPTSIFSSETYVHYEGFQHDDVVYADQNEDRELTSKQMDEIFKTGKFKIESTIPDLPYEWYITKWIIKGTDNIYKDFIDAVGLSFYLIYKMKYRFIYTGNLGFSFQDSFKAIWTGLKEAASCFVGLPSYEYKRQDHLVIKSLQKEFVQQFMQEYPNFNIDIFLPEVTQQIKLVSEAFEAMWEKESHDIEQRLFEGRITNEEVKNQLYKLRIEKALDFLDKIHEEGDLTQFNREILTHNLCQRIKEYFLAHNIVDKNFLIENAKIIDVKNEIEVGIQNEFNVRSRVQEWKNNKINNVQALRIKEIKKETEGIIMSELQANNIDEPFILFAKNCTYQDIYTEMFNKSIESNLKMVPSMYFSVGFYYITPKEVYLHTEDDGREIYKIKEGYFWKMPSSYPFWRFPLYVVRYFGFSYNIAITAWRMIFNNRFGLSSFYKDKIIDSYECDPQTGALTPTEGASTLKSNLSKLCTSITEDRDNFENSPDDSFFGKNCARIFNIIYNYIIKTFVAFFAFMIGYPIVIFLWTIFWFIVLISCYVWGLIAIVFLAMFNLFILDIDYPGKDGHGLGLIPIIFYTILVKFVFQFAATIFLLVGQPLLAILVFFLGALRLVFRFMYDCFMYLIIYLFAKTPISDSFLAWKISGPGLTRKYFNHIEITEALTVVHAYLEKCELLNFKNQVSFLLEEPYRKNAHSIAKHFIHYDLKFQPNPELLESIKFYKDKLINSIYDRVQFFPRVKNVKFTNDELTTLKISSREYIRDYVTSHRMEYLFDEYKIPKNSWGKLNEIILVQTFGEQVLESFTDMDFKIEIKREENLNFDGIKFHIVEKSGINYIKNKNLQKKIHDIELNNLEIREIYNPGTNRFLYLNISILNENDDQIKNSSTLKNASQYERNRNTIINMNNNEQREQ